MSVPHPSHKGGPRDRDLPRIAEVADLYWVQGVKVEDIGERLHLSRSTVSRMLAKAREHGVIEFIVHRSLDGTNRLGSLLSGRYGVTARVVPADQDATGAELVNAVAIRAAEHLHQIISSDMVVSVAWGSTIEAVSLQLTGRPTHRTRIVQQYGSVNVYSTGTNYASHILDRFGRAFTAMVHHFPVPAFFDSASTREAMWQERSVQRILDLRRSADVLVTSVGTLTSEYQGHLFRSGYLSGEDIEALRRRGVIGSLGATFFRADGSTDAIPINDRSTGMRREEFAGIPTRLVVAADPAKAVALKAAIAAGFVSDVILDSLTARALLDA